MGKYILLFIVIFGLAQGALYCQEMYAVRGTVYIKDGKADRVNLSVFSSDREKRIPVDIDGDFTTQLDWNNNYQFYFSKPGYISKKIDFSTIVPTNINESRLYPYQLLVELFPMFPHADTAFFRNPVAKIKYSDINNDFDYDLNYQLVVKEKVQKLKKDYQSFLKQNISKPVPAKEIVVKNQEVAALRYQKRVETSQKKKIVPVKTAVSRPEKDASNNESNPFGLPPLKALYPNGKSIESYKRKGKVITRIIMKNDNYQKAFYRVKHNWGGLYYFVQESPTYYRSISKYNFEKATKI